MTIIEALIIAVVVLGLVAALEAVIIAALYRSRPVVERGAPPELPRPSNGETAWDDRTGVKQMKRALRSVKPRKRVANDG